MPEINTYNCNQRNERRLKTCLKYFFLFCVLTGFLPRLKSQDKGPVVRFTFNGNNLDDIDKLKAKLVGINYTTDRFGNENYAVFISGNPYSYINLGTSKKLKPSIGSISLWIKIENPVWSGKGIDNNPIILTKCDSLDDFYEAYSLYYLPETKKIAASLSKDFTSQVNLYIENKFKFNKWHHLVVAYDNENASLYMDGKLGARFPKHFKTSFLEGDSVLMGVTGSKKNERFLKASVDDIEFYNRALNEDEVLNLFNAPNPNKSKKAIDWILAILGLAILITIIYFIVRYRLSLTLKKEKQQLELHNVMLETELRVNRALMNPHFVFNSLNTLQNFILKNENQRANNYLVKFSKLVRRLLESNMSDSISLAFEIELLTRYLEIEDLRFEENIKHNITVEASIAPSNIEIPVMMIQPFVENAIWHGLLKKEGDKQLYISFSIVDGKYILCTIEDNGLGRKQRAPEFAENKSLATGFIEQRLKLMNEIYGYNCTLTIEDKLEPRGTIVKILLPILNRQ